MWITRWKLTPQFNWHWWMIGFHFEYGWSLGIAIGPVGLVLSKEQIHI